MGERGNMNSCYRICKRNLPTAGPKARRSIARSKTCVIFINQIRMKIGVMFGNPETTTGGRALKFYASQRLDIRRIGALKDGQEVIGNRTRVKVVKNKLAPPFREVEFDLMYGEGISREGSIIDMGVQHGIIEKSGSWFSYQGERLGQGRERVKALLKENTALAKTLEDAVLQKTGVTESETSNPEPIPAEMAEA